MKNEMIERVAKAIDKAILDWEYPNDVPFHTFIARAAIQAMYKPTDQQRNFYYKLKRESGSTPAYSTFEDATWEMMILACLEQSAIDEHKMD